jgi:hypothetical protein
MALPTLCIGTKRESDKSSNFLAKTISGGSVALFHFSATGFTNNHTFDRYLRSALYKRGRNYSFIIILYLCMNKELEGRLRPSLVCGSQGVPLLPSDFREPSRDCRFNKMPFQSMIDVVNAVRVVAGTSTLEVNCDFL